MEGWDPVVKVCLFVFLISTLLFMARVERYLRGVSSSAQRIADALERATGKGNPPAAGPPPTDER